MSDPCPKTGQMAIAPNVSVGVYGSRMMKRNDQVRHEVLFPSKTGALTVCWVDSSMYRDLLAAWKLLELDTGERYERDTFAKALVDRGRLLINERTCDDCMTKRRAQ